MLKSYFLNYLSFFFSFLLNLLWTLRPPEYTVGPKLPLDHTDRTRQMPMLITDFIGRTCM